MRNKYFTYHWDSGFETWQTEDEAKSHADKMLSEEIDWEDGVMDEAEKIYWGEIKQQALISPTGEKVEFDGELVDSVKVELVGV